MGYTLSKQTAQRVLRVINTIDHTPLRVPEKGSTVDASAFDDVLLCQVESGSAAEGYTCKYYTDYEAWRSGTATGTCVVYISELAGDADLPVGSLLVGHHTYTAVVGGNDY